MKFEIFGIKLAQLRMQKNLSAYELSLRIGKNHSYINRIECGKLNPSLKSILEICEMLEISPKELFE